MSEDEQIKAALNDYHALTLTLWGESRNQPIEGIVAVANVIRNRRRASAGNYRDVVFKRAQFSCWSPKGGAANYAAVMVFAKKLTGDYAFSTTIPTDAAFKECAWVAEGMLGNQLRDNVRGANHYLERTLFEQQTVSWAKGVTPVARIGDHVFLLLKEHT